MMFHFLFTSSGSVYDRKRDKLCKAECFYFWLKSHNFLCMAQRVGRGQIAYTWLPALLDHLVLWDSMCWQKKEHIVWPEGWHWTSYCPFCRPYWGGKSVSTNTSCKQQLEYILLATVYKWLHEWRLWPNKLNPFETKLRSSCYIAITLALRFP